MAIARSITKKLHISKESPKKNISSPVNLLYSTYNNGNIASLIDISTAAGSANSSRCGSDIELSPQSSEKSPRVFRKKSMRRYSMASDVSCYDDDWSDSENHDNRPLDCLGLKYNSVNTYASLVERF